VKPSNNIESNNDDEGKYEEQSIEIEEDDEPNSEIESSNSEAESESIEVELEQNAINSEQEYEEEKNENKEIVEEKTEDEASKAVETNNSRPEKPIIEKKDEILTETNSTEVEINEDVVKAEKIEKPKTETKPEKPVLYDVLVGFPNHKLFDEFLKTYVTKSGVVNYSGMKKQEDRLTEYLTSLKKTKITTTWSRNEKLAFWINAYNAYTIKLILDNYPVKKITDLHGGKPWDVKWIKLDGKTLSLNNIENDIIRPVFKEPRIHFAVNCAAKSCPPILNAAFTAGTLEKQLESQTKKFINNNQHNTLGKNEITISKIFDWYGGDFGDVASYIAKYANGTVKPTAKVKFNEYNWELNGK
jgi:hypothetical protein